MVVVLIILVINMVYVSLLTVRTIFILKGKRYLASIVSAGEAFVFVLGVGLVIENLSNIQNLFAYAAGFALGVLLGTKIEERLALGYVTVKVISDQIESLLPHLLRRKGFGVTSWLGEGRDGQRLVMEILTSRKDQKDLYNYIIAAAPGAFIVSYEPQHFRGGFWTGGLRRYCKKYGKSMEHPFEEVLPGVTEETIKEAQAAIDKNGY